MTVRGRMHTRALAGGRSSSRARRRRAHVDFAVSSLPPRLRADRQSRKIQAPKKIRKLIGSRRDHEHKAGKGRPEHVPEHRARPKITRFKAYMVLTPILTWRDELLTGQLFPKLCQEIGARLDAAMEVGDREFFVGPVQVIVVLAPAEQKRVDAQLLLDQADDRDRAALADEDRLLAEPDLDGPDGGHARPACRC